MARSSLWFFLALLLLATVLTTYAWARRPDEPMRGGRQPRSREEERERQKEMERREREREQERRRHRRGEEEGEHGRAREQPQIQLGQAQEILQSDGGRLRVWSEEIDAIRNKHVGIGELELEQDGLLVPQYSDSDKIAYVLEGRGVVGAVNPSSESDFQRTYIHRVQRGDVIALPKGVVYWWYNEGNDRHRVLCAGDTTFGVHPGRFHQFGLAGSKEDRFGSLLHGFSRDMLATAWGVDEKTMQSLLERQKDAGIVKARQKIRFTELPHEQEQRSSEEEHEERRRREEERDEAQNHHAATTFHFEELKYSTRPEHPDLFVEKAGYVNLVDHHKLPALHQVGFSAIKASLEKNALCAPAFVQNAHQLIYFTRGNGRVQVASGEGQTVFDDDVREGTVLAIPQLFPSLKIAGDQGLEWISLLTSSAPSASFLAGRNSVYRAIPKQVIAAAFNVDEGKLRELGRDQEILFPPKESEQRERRDDNLWNQHGRREDQGREEDEQKRREREEEQRRRREQEEEEERKRREERRRREEEERRREEEERRRRREEDTPGWLASLKLL